MHPPPGQMKHQETVQITETFKADIFDRTDEYGHRHVAILLEQRLPDGSKAQFVTDMDRLESVIRNGEDYQNSEDRSELLEKGTKYTAQFNRAFSDENGWMVAVRLEQPGWSVAEKTQSFSTTLPKLKEIQESGRAIENELGYDRSWHNLVARNTFKTDSDGKIEATVYASVQGLEEAQRRLKDNSSLAIAPETTRRPIEAGSTIRLAEDDPIEIKGGEAITVKTQMSDTQWSKERLGEKYVVALWNDVGRDPRIGDKAFYEGDSHEINGKPQDFRARPQGRGDQGEPEKPLYVLLEKDGKLPRNAKIVAMSESRGEMTTELGHREEAHHQQNQELARQEAINKMVSSDWHKQDTGMNRRI